MLDTTTKIFGAAEVIETVGDLTVRLKDGFPAKARLALSAPYEPIPGDEVLVIGETPEDLYVIGVICGRGPMIFNVPGDLVFRAKRIEMDAPEVCVRAGKLELLAGCIIQKAKDVYQWLTGILSIRSRRVRTQVESSWHLKAERVNLRATDDVNIDGENINLG